MPLIRSSILWVVCGLFSQVAASTEPMTPVKLQLKWQHQFQFAGYYAAIKKGFYQEAGLKVSLIEAKPGENHVQAVLSGEVEFGVGTSELLLDFHKGEPVVVLAAIMQHSPLALASLKSSGITNIHQVAAEPIMMESNSLELLAYLKSEGIDIESLQLVEHSIDIQEFVQGKVASMSIYTTDETYAFDIQNVEYQLFRPISSGIDFYGDNLFTTQQMIKHHPRVVESFRQASIKGWKYAMQNPDEIIDFILSDFSDRKSREHLNYEAEKMLDLMRPDLVEIGYMNQGRWQHIAHTYSQLGLLPNDFNVQNVLYQSTDFAYEELKKQFYYVIAISGLILLLAVIFYRQYQVANLRRKQFEALFVNAPVSLMEIDTKGIIYNWNREAEKTFQYSDVETLGKNVFELIVHKENVKNIDSVVASASESNHIVYSENANIRKDGEELLCQWANLPFETEDRNEKRVICMARDITSEKAMEEKLYQAAHYDELTGLANRTLVLDLFKEAIADAKRHQQQLAILFIDLNDFKGINDRYGHLVGDEVLRQFAARLKHALRESDLVGRLSGDEFLVIIKDLLNNENLQKVIDKISKAIEMEMKIDQLSLSISGSIGVSLYPQEADEIQQLIQIADQQMYKDKAARKASES